MFAKEDIITHDNKTRIAQIPLQHKIVTLIFKFTDKDMPFVFLTLFNEGNFLVGEFIAIHKIIKSVIMTVSQKLFHSLLFPVNDLEHFLKKRREQHLIADTHGLEKIILGELTFEGNYKGRGRTVADKILSNFHPNFQRRIPGRKAGEQAPPP
jgi:hypothetical protein